ncbi:MAG: N-acetylmuramoyl-L-alanine amidase [Treponema sp.]|jgi:N-acetylmuramoyl-L-alanine amidase|nr:N-acetylmuramoyl-L-alanine amidase [Treponema sp.]
MKRSFILIFCLLPVSFPAFGQTALPKTLSLEEALISIGQKTGKTAETEFRWDPFLSSGTFTAGGHSAAFFSGGEGESGMLLLDGREFFDVPAPYVHQGLLRFPEAFISTAALSLSRSIEEDASRFNIAAVIIDPGHGGKDSGAVGNFTVNGKPFRSVEKDIVLNVSKKLYSRLSAAYPDKRILMTREGDTFPTLENRVAIANSVPLKANEAIIFISIHANSSFNKKARGYEVWYLSPEYRRNVIDTAKYADSSEVIPIINDMMEEEFTTESIMMAQSILGRIGEASGNRIPSRGLKAEEWFVVRNARMPSVLVELGFVSNLEDALLMSDEGYLQKLGEALYKGIGDFITRFEMSGGFTTIQ